MIPTATTGCATILQYNNQTKANGPKVFTPLNKAKKKKSNSGNRHDEQLSSTSRIS